MPARRVASSTPEGSPSPAHPAATPAVLVLLLIFGLFGLFDPVGLGSTLAPSRASAATSATPRLTLLQQIPWVDPGSAPFTARLAVSGPRSPRASPPSPRARP
jgi:hypothetical protein